MKSASWFGLTIALIPCLASCARARTTALQVDSARETLRAAETGALAPGTAVITTPLVAYTFHQEVRLSSGAHAFVIGADTGGGILTFRPDGSRLNAIESGEIVSVLFTKIGGSDFVVLARQVDGAGTGFREENHHLYRLSPSGVEEVWEGLAYLLEVGPAEKSGVRERSERRGFLDLDAGGFGSHARLIHFMVDVPTGRTNYRTYTLVDGRPRSAGSQRDLSRIPPK